MSPSSARNLLIFTTVSSVWAIIFGLIGPFYVVHVEKLSGGMEKLGFAFSIMILFQSATAYFAGRFSDRLGRKPFLFLTAYTDATVLFLYTVIDQTYHLYLLQGILGITNGVAETIWRTLLGDLMTVKDRYGFHRHSPHHRNASGMHIEIKPKICHRPPPLTLIQAPDSSSKGRVFFSVQDLQAMAL